MWLRHKENSKKRLEAREEKKTKKICPFKPVIKPMNINMNDASFLNLKNPSIVSIQTYVG